MSRRAVVIPDFNSRRGISLPLRTTGASLMPYMLETAYVRFDVSSLPVRCFGVWVMDHNLQGKWHWQGPTEDDCFGSDFPFREHGLVAVAALRLVCLALCHDVR